MAVPVLGPYENSQMLWWIQSGADSGAYNIDSVVDIGGYSKNITVSGPDQALVDDSLQRAFDAMAGRVSFIDVASQATKEGVAEAGSAVVSTAKTAGSAVAGALSPIVGALTPVLIIVGLGLTVFLIYRFKK